MENVDECIVRFQMERFIIYLLRLPPPPQNRSRIITRSLNAWRSVGQLSQLVGCCLD